MQKLCRNFSKFNIKYNKKTTESYQQRQKVRKRKIINPMVTSGVDQIWQMDLIDFQKYAQYNDGYK